MPQRNGSRIHRRAVIDRARRAVVQTNAALAQSAAAALTAARQALATRATIEKSGKVLHERGYERSATERALLVDHLSQTRNHIAESEHHVRRQQN